MRGKREERRTVIERRRGQEGPEAEHDGLKTVGSHLAKGQTESQRETTGNHIATTLSFK